MSEVVHVENGKGRLLLSTMPVGGNTVTQIFIGGLGLDDKQHGHVSCKYRVRGGK